MNERVKGLDCPFTLLGLIELELLFNAERGGRALAKCPYLDELHNGEEDVVSVDDFDRYCLLCNCRLKSNDALVREVCADLNDEFKACPMYKEETTIMKLRREKMNEVKCS